MWLWISLAVLLLLCVPLAIGLRRATDLFVIEVVDGKPRLQRGRLPPALMSEVVDIVRRNRVRSGRFRVVTEGGEPRVLAEAGLPDAAVQQLRNVVGRYRVAQFRTGRLRA